MLSDRSVDIYNIHGLVFCAIGSFVPITQKCSARMHTAAYNADIASDRRRRENVPRHILGS